MSRLKWQLIIVTVLLYQRSISAQDTSKRIVKGFNADPKQFPYQVYFTNLVDSYSSGGCGGVIISNRIVLTAAHCLSRKFDAVEIYFGTVDRSNKREVGQQRLIVKAKNIVVHPEYDHFINDIALIRLPADLLFDEYIQPAKLPDVDELYENESAVVSGWGQTTFKGPQWNHLQYYNVTVFSNEKCKNVMITVSKIFPTSFICLKPSQSTPCHGDSGGPLAIRNEDGSHTLLGLTSFGNLGCPTNSPVVYTRVSSFLKWIKQYE